MSARNVHIVGGGLAGLAAAVRLRRYGRAVTLYEAAPRAGGRCRSFHDPQLDAVIDNGNHLLLSGNTDAMAYLAEIGAADQVVGPASTGFDFIDTRSGLCWSVKPGAGPLPWWILDARRRVPDTRLSDYWSIVRLLRADGRATVAACIDPDSVLASRFWEPLTLAVLNTAPREAAAILMQAVLRETVAKGAHACRPLVARHSLAEALVDPALATLSHAGVDVKLGARVTAIHTNGGVVSALTLDGRDIAIRRDDTVILAVPAWTAADLMPGLTVPPPGAPIVNIHYRLAAVPPGETPPRIVGVIGGLAQWVFQRGEIASVTISGAEAEAELSAEDLSARCWPEVAAALGLEATVPPPSRVIKERRATPAQTPAAVAARPPARTSFENLLLAGDWTDTGVPATIEGAVRSGFRAARLTETRMAAGTIHRGAA